MSDRSDQLRMHLGSPLAAVLLAVMCVSLSGCVVSNWFNGRFPGGPFGRSMPCVLPPNVSKSELVAHLNENIAKLHSWRSTDVRIQTRGPGGLPIKLSAVIAVESPRNFRLRACSALGDEADLGSNAERFWFWVCQGGPNYVFTARHDELHLVQQRMPIPFQPDWLIETLGVVPIDESQYTLERHGTEAATADLVSDRLSPDGRPVRQVVLVDTCHGYIKQHTLSDRKGRLIARATFKDHETDTATGVTLPRRIELHWPQAKLSLTLHLNTVEVNPDGLPDQMWQLPNIRGYPPFDMGPRLRRNRLDDDGRGAYGVPADFRQVAEPGPPDRFVRTAEAVEPPWETDAKAPEPQAPMRRPIWRLPRLFQRR